jgi:hypothetical protein
MPAGACAYDKNVMFDGRFCDSTDKLVMLVTITGEYQSVKQQFVN